MRRIQLLFGAVICLAFAVLDWFLGIPAAPSYASASNVGNVGDQGAICNTYVNGILTSSVPCNGSSSGSTDYHYIFVGLFVPSIVLTLACLIAVLLSERAGKLVTKSAVITIFVPIVAVGLIDIGSYNPSKYDLIQAMAITAAIAWPIIYFFVWGNAPEEVAPFRFSHRTANIGVNGGTPFKASNFFKGLLAIVIWAWAIAILGEIILKRKFGLSDTSSLYTELILLFWISGIVFGAITSRRSWAYVLIFCAIGVLLIITLVYLLPKG